MYHRHQHIHFVGIGGIGMSGIAELLINLGHKVSGSDLKESDITARLAGLGATIHQGHHYDWVEEADVVVISSAVPQDNPEVVAARRQMIPVIPRAEMLAELMRLKYGVAVAGAHGKTTATSMAATLFSAGGLDPTIVVGGKLAALGSNAKLGAGDFLVAEADESDGSFNKLSPVVVVVTNIDREHLDHYGDYASLEDAFVEFMNKVPFYGAAILCLDDPGLAALVPRVNKRTVTYGLASQADFQAREISTAGIGVEFDLYVRGEKIARAALPMAGRHNVLNALGAVAAACEVGIPAEKAAAALALCQNVGRRFESKGVTASGALVLDDYAHHPTEIKATLEAARSVWPDKRLVICFQPHRYSRSALLLEEFATCFYGADVLLVLDIYPAGEKPIEGVSAGRMAEAIATHGHRQVEFVGDKKSAADRLGKLLGEGDVLFTMGAGDVWQVGAALVEKA